MSKARLHRIYLASVAAIVVGAFVIDLAVEDAGLADGAVIMFGALTVPIAAFGVVRLLRGHMSHELIPAPLAGWSDQALERWRAGTPSAVIAFSGLYVGFDALVFAGADSVVAYAGIGVCAVGVLLQATTAFARAPRFLVPATMR